eukprot:6050194-Alexandrium_andersonii.AAC.1
MVVRSVLVARAWKGSSSGSASALRMAVGMPVSPCDLVKWRLRRRTGTSYVLGISEWCGVGVT